MEFHSVEMSASGRQCHLWVWRVVCPTTETYYISVHTNTYAHRRICTRILLRIAPLQTYSIRGRAMQEGRQWSGGLDGAMGQGGTMAHCLARLTDKQPDEITHWLIGWLARYKHSHHLIHTSQMHNCAQCVSTFCTECKIACTGFWVLQLAGHLYNSSNLFIRLFLRDKMPHRCMHRVCVQSYTS